MDKWRNGVTEWFVWIQFVHKRRAHTVNPMSLLQPLRSTMFQKLSMLLPWKMIHKQFFKLNGIPNQAIYSVRIDTCTNIAGIRMCSPQRINASPIHMHGDLYRFIFWELSTKTILLFIKTYAFKSWAYKKL